MDAFLSNDQFGYCTICLLIFSNAQHRNAKKLEKNVDDSRKKDQHLFYSDISVRREKLYFKMDCVLKWREHNRIFDMDINWIQQWLYLFTPIPNILNEFCFFYVRVLTYLTLYRISIRWTIVHSMLRWLKWAAFNENIAHFISFISISTIYFDVYFCKCDKFSMRDDNIPYTKPLKCMKNSRTWWTIASQITTIASMKKTHSWHIAWHWKFYL